MKNLNNFLIMVVFFILVGCGSNNAGSSDNSQNEDRPHIINISFRSLPNNESAVGIITGESINVQMPSSSNLESMIPHFNISSATKLLINNEPQINDKTINNLSLPVAYTIKAINKSQTTSYKLFVIKLAPPKQITHYLYLNNNGDNSVYLYKIGPNTGQLSFSESTLNISSPFDIKINKSGTFVYVSNLQNNSISMFRRDLDNGELTLFSESTIPTPNKKGATFITLSPDDLNLYNAGFDRDGTVAMYGVNLTTGGLTILNPPLISVESTDISAYEPKFTPNGNYGYVATTGNAGNIYQYSRDKSTGQLTKLSSLTLSLGSPSIWFTISSSGTFWYSIDNSNPSKIFQGTINESTGQLTQLTPNYILNTSQGNYITIDNTTQHLYISNLDKTITVFSINNTGALTLLHTISTKLTPTSLLFDSSGQYLYASNMVDSAISMYHIESSTGNLIPLNPETIPAGNTPIMMATF